MVREIVVNGHAAARAAYFEPAFDAFEIGKRLDRDGRRHADVAGSGDRRERVAPVMRPGFGQHQPTERLSAESDVERVALVLVYVRRMPRIGEPESLDLRPDAAA